MKRKIPITIGITGHREIKPECVDEIKALLKSELEKIIAACPNSDIIMLNSLASGADLLACSVAQELKMPVRAILPLEKIDYAKDFDEGSKTQFEDALCYANDVLVVPTPSEALRDECYRQAGLYVAKHSHILIALWDGEEGKMTGCGTADIVKQTIENESGYVILHILTPRGEVYEKPCVKLIEHKEGAKDDVLKKTDEFNKEKAEGEPYDMADTLSVQYQKKYKHSLIALALIGVAMVLAFLLYDELDYRICVPIWGVLLIAGAWVLKAGNKKEYHSKYIEYRMLAECLRVQKVLNKAGVVENAAGFYTWTHADDTFWIKKAIYALENVTVAEELSYDKDWIVEQLDYHTRASESTKKKDRKNDRFSMVFKILTVASLVATLILEYFCGDAMQNIYLGIELRTYFLVLIGLFSAMSLLLSLYYGKLNLNRKYEDHINMIKLYKRALKLFENGDITEEDILRIAREEIIENGNWYSYTKEETLDINI